MERSINLRVLLSTHEKRMLVALAGKDGLTVADTVRQLIRRRFDVAGLCPYCQRTIDIGTYAEFGGCVPCTEANNAAEREEEDVDG